MSSTTNDRKTAPYPVVLVIGLALAVGGFYLSKSGAVKIAPLEEAGIPVDLGKTLATFGVLLMVFPVVRSFFIEPLEAAIRQRTNDLESTFSEASELRGRMETMKSDYEKRLVETESAARAQIQEQIAEARRIADERIAKVNGEIDEMKAKAIEELENERKRVLTDLRVHVVDLTLAATEKILGENMDSDKNRKLIDDFVATAEVKR